jgi:phage gp29-like protein
MTLAAPPVRRTSLALDRPRMLATLPAQAFASTDFSIAEAMGSHPEFGLTPRRLVAIFRAAEAGYPAEQCDLFQGGLERDAHWRSQHEQAIDAVAGKEWIWAPGGPDEIDAIAARLLEDACRKVESYEDSIRHQLMTGSYGYSGTEVLWDRVDGMTVPVWFANTPHRRFRFDYRGEARIITTHNRTEGEALAPGSWIFSRREQNDTVRSGLARTAIWLSSFKQLGFRDFVVSLERHGMPSVIGTYETGTTDEDKTVLKQHLASLGKDGYAIMHESCKVVMEAATALGSADGAHGYLIRLVDEQISKLYAGSTLMSDGGQQGATHALGAVQATRSFDRVSASAKAIGSVYSQQLARAFCHYNGLPAKTPVFTIHVVQETDPVTRMGIFSAAQKLGVPISARQIRTEFQLKPPIDDDDTLGPPPVPSPFGAPPATPMDGPPDAMPMDPAEEP